MLHTSLIVCVYYGRYIRQVIAIIAKTEIADICRKLDKWLDTIVLFIKQNWLQKACNRLAEAPTIIEADRSEEE